MFYKKIFYTVSRYARLENLLLSRQKYLKAMQSANIVKFLFRKHVISYEAKLHMRARHSRCKKRQYKCQYV